MIILYRLLYLLFLPFFLLFGILFSKKIRQYITTRKTNLPKSTSIKPVWIHASSGEFEHAKYLIRSIKEKYPLQKIVVSYSSPSYFNAVKKFDLIDGYIPMPIDLKGPISSLIKRINPKIILFSRTDLWPELMHQLNKKKIPSVVFSRMEKEESSFGEKLLFPITYKKVDHISFVSEADKETFIKKYNHLKGLSVDGDPRVEEVISRAAKSNQEDKAPKKTLILGSVWPEDLKSISEGMLKSLKEGSLKQVIAAPHDPTAEHIKELQKVFKDFSISLYSKDPELLKKVVIVDTTGKLFDLYAKADIAFVGGSFKKKVHSVIEPLAHGLPVLVGPFIDNNTEAKLYSSSHSYVKVSKDSAEFSNNLSSLLNLKKDDLIELKISIKDSLSQSTGASGKIISLIEEKIELYS
ncbi:MAG: 3-deoxy-D-manno-octulosonic acid transferase [Bdellovibrionales bacterium]